jgi:hypothetical protein
VKPAVVLPESGGDVLLRQPHGFEGVRVVSGARFVSGQAGDGLENEYRADPENEPVPHAEALVYPFTDGDSNDESEGADRPPVTNARLRPSHALPPRWIPIGRFISARRLGHNRAVERGTRRRTLRTRGEPAPTAPRLRGLRRGSHQAFPALAVVVGDTDNMVLEIDVFGDFCTELVERPRS